MAGNPAVPYWDEANTFTGRTSATVTGKRFVTISGARIDGHPRVAHAVGSATARACGVSAYDAPSGGDVTVINAPGIIVPVTATGAVTAGQDVYSAADGRATATQPAGARPSGLAMDDAADGADLAVKLL